MSEIGARREGGVVGIIVAGSAVPEALAGVVVGAGAGVGGCGST